MKEKLYGYTEVENNSRWVTRESPVQETWWPHCGKQVSQLKSLKLFPQLPLLANVESDKRQKIICMLPALPDFSSSYCVSKYLKVKKDKKVRWGEKKIRKKI